MHSEFLKCLFLLLAGFSPSTSAFFLRVQYFPHVSGLYLLALPLFPLASPLLCASVKVRQGRPLLLPASLRQQLVHMQEPALHLCTCTIKVQRREHQWDNHQPVENGHQQTSILPLVPHAASSEMCTRRCLKGLSSNSQSGGHTVTHPSVVLFSFPASLPPFPPPVPWDYFPNKLPKCKLTSEDLLLEKDQAKTDSLALKMLRILF